MNNKQAWQFKTRLNEELPYVLKQSKQNNLSEQSPACKILTRFRTAAYLNVSFFPLYSVSKSTLTIQDFRSSYCRGREYLINSKLNRFPLRTFDDFTLILIKLTNS